MRVLTSIGILFLSFAVHADSDYEYAIDKIDENFVWMEVTDTTEFQKLLEDSNLKDPFSVKLRKVTTREADGRTFYCGEIMSKNSFGAYTGWHAFSWGSTDGLYVKSGDTDDLSVVMDKLKVDVVCLNSPSSPRQDQ